MTRGTTRYQVPPTDKDNHAMTITPPRPAVTDAALRATIAGLASRLRNIEATIDRVADEVAVIATSLHGLAGADE